MTKVCRCNILRAWSREPGAPIEFDQRFREFRIVCQSGFKILRFCPACGERLPKSKRPTIDPRTSKEGDRIRKMIIGLKTRKDLVKKFGEPQSEQDGGMTATKYDKNGRVQTVLRYKSLTYLGLSKSADVTFHLRPKSDGISLMLSPKSGPA